MRISIDKTEVMVVGKETKVSNIQMGNEILKKVSEFKYLGNIISWNGKIESAMEHRCSKASQILGQLSPILKHKHVNIDTKRTLYNTISIPTLCYQCQTWTLTAKEKRKITTTEMRCLRRILNITRRDRIRNDEIRRRVGVTSALAYITKQQSKWFEHVTRMSPDNIPLKALKSRSHSKRRRGRPPKRWINNIIESLEMTAYEANNRALSRTLHFPSTLRGIRGQENR
jgi:hypothetical protein